MPSDTQATMLYANRLQWKPNFHLHSRHHHMEHTKEPDNHQNFYFIPNKWLSTSNAALKNCHWDIDTKPLLLARAICYHSLLVVHAISPDFSPNQYFINNTLHSLYFMYLNIHIIMIYNGREHVMQTIHMAYNRVAKVWMTATG